MRRGRFRNIVILAFLLTQVLDGALTYWGVKTGLAIEGNPIMAIAFSYLGLGLGVILFKIWAMGLGVLLHQIGRHKGLLVITVIYVLFAIVPWVAIFASIL